MPSATDHPPAHPEAAAAPRMGHRAVKIHAIGTLRYTTGGLFFLFIWLLLGDFCSVMFQQIFKNFLPLFLEKQHASNTLISFLTMGVGGFMNLLLLPNISMASDRCRTRWGRRIPFLFFATPFAAVALIAIGYSEEMGRWLHTVGGPLAAVSQTAVVLGVIFLLVVVYDLSLMITNNVFQYLVRDVVPQDVMVSFLAIFRVMGVVAGCLYNWFLFRFVVDHPKVLCTAIGTIYFVSFALICWQVKEGRYPPPPPQVRQNPILGALRSYGRYFRQCMSVGIYRNYIFVYVLWITATFATAPFMVLFSTKTLKVSVDDYGKILSVATLVGGVSYLLMAYLCKRFHCLRVALASLILLAVCAAAGLLFVKSETAWLVYHLAIALPTVGWALGSVAVTMTLFPADKFGQLSSSLFAIGWGSLALTSYLVGKFIDYVGGNYRMVFLVSLVGYTLAILPMLQVYRAWKTHGGPTNYIPPEPN
jgi:Na+/melibiose symporter-like transporter